MKEKLQELVEKAMDLGAFDLHVKAAFPPIVRIANNIKRLDMPPFSPKEIEALLLGVLDEKQRVYFKNHGQIDCSIDFAGKARVRANIFFQRNSLAASFRLVPLSAPNLAKLGFSRDIVSQILGIKRGMLLVTGATNSGKSTTVASIVNLLAEKLSIHIISIEDPIEYIFNHSPQSIISQRQVGEDTPDFSTGLTSALRQDPDVIVIGELRDQETVETCLKASETGHLVLGTLHTSNAVQSILRLINIFPSFQRENIRFMVSSSLRLIISQVLLPAIDHKKRVLAYEILPNLPSVANLIRQQKIHEINSVLRLGRRSGCVPMNISIKELVKTGMVKYDDIPKELLSEA